MPFLLLMLIVLVHELGHFLCALFLRVPVDRICIYPFGGVSKFHSKINIPLKQEFLILVMGPLVQFLFMLLLKSHLPQSYQEIFLFYNWNILSFNMLPIYPLDGGRLLNILFSYHFSYRKSFMISLCFSLFGVISFFLISLQDMKLNLLFLTFLLLSKIYEEYQRRNFYQEKFLLERYLEKNMFSKRCRVEKIDDFKRDCKHLVKGKNGYQTEKEALEKKFQKKY